MVESHRLRPDTDHTPTVQYDNCGHDNIEHGPGADTSPALNRPKGIDAHRLSCKACHEQVGQLDGIVGLDFILQGLNDSDGGVEAIA